MLNTLATQHLTKKRKLFYQDEQFYPSDETISHLEVYEDLGPKFLGIYNDLFLEFKMYRKSW